MNVTSVNVCWLKRSKYYAKTHFWGIFYIWDTFCKFWEDEENVYIEIIYCHLNEAIYICTRNLQFNVGLKILAFINISNYQALKLLKSKPCIAKHRVKAVWKLYVTTLCWWKRHHESYTKQHFADELLCFFLLIMWNTFCVCTLDVLIWRSQYL